MSAAVWSLADQIFVSVPDTRGQAWLDRETLIRAGRRLAVQLEVREIEHRCENGHDRDDYEGGCPFCDADEAIREAHQERDVWGEKCDALEQEIEDLRAELADRDEVAAMAAGNARQDTYLRGLTDRGIDPYAPATS